MIPNYLPAILSVSYILADVIFIFAFQRVRFKLRRIDVNMILLVKFKDLLEFYNRGEASSFVKNLIDKAQASENVSVSQFADNYAPISGEIEKLRERFLLPYSLMQMPGDVRSEEVQCAILAALNIGFLYASYYYSLLYEILFAILLVNTIFWYPLISAFVNSRNQITQALDIISKL